MNDVNNANASNNPATMNRGLGVWRLIAVSIGSTLASGVFTIPRDMAAEGANTGAVLIGWIICGLGMMALMMCFYNLNKVRPDLASGIFSYARAGFGEYIGFNSAWGYWISCVLAQVSFATLFFAALSYFFPFFGDGNNLASIIGASIVLWLMMLLVMRGVSQATTINLIVVITKIIPIVFLIIAVLFARSFQWSVFTENFWGDGTVPLFDQIKGTIYTTVWVFIGVEGAVVISGRAKKMSDAGKAAVISFLSMLGLYMVISILSMGVLPKDELAELANPAMAGLVEYVVGPWGAVVVSLAVCISIGGAMYTYTILVAESAYAPAELKAFPKVFKIQNKQGAPVGSLIISTAIIQLFLIIVLFNESTYQIVYFLSASMIMVPYLLSAAYYLKLMIQGKGISSEHDTSKGWAWIFAIIGTVYGFWLLYASGLGNVLAMAILYAPGLIIYVWTKNQYNESAFGKTADKVCLIAIILMFIAASIGMYNGSIVVL